MSLSAGSITRTRQRKLDTSRRGLACLGVAHEQKGGDRSRAFDGIVPPGPIEERSPLEPRSAKFNPRLHQPGEPCRQFDDVECVDIENPLQHPTCACFAKRYCILKNLMERVDFDWSGIPGHGIGQLRRSPGWRKPRWLLVRPGW